MNPSRVLIVEDDRAIADLIEIHLRNEGFDVLRAAEGGRALALMNEHDVQLVILDLMLSGMDGLAVCRKIRQDRNIPILILSARSEETDKVLGLSAGADDYLAKPFSILELLARVRSQLRRYLVLNPGRRDGESEAKIAAGDLIMNKDLRTVAIDGREIHLTAIEFDILYLLAGHPGRVFSAEEIFKTVWADRYYDSNNTVMVHVRKIREKIEENPGRPVRVRTIWGVGYKYAP
ncbi:MAG: response regulator transcription factor [Candidatus Aminicenantes bacterium]|nr:response regulator transcription factor [Candidatus Aminicenantes bacterium]